MSFVWNMSAFYINIITLQLQFSIRLLNSPDLMNMEGQKWKWLMFGSKVMVMSYLLFWVSIENTGHCKLIFMIASTVSTVERYGKCLVSCCWMCIQVWFYMIPPTHVYILWTGMLVRGWYHLKQLPSPGHCNYIPHSAFRLAFHAFDKISWKFLTLRMWGTFYWHCAYIKITFVTCQQ